MCSVPQYLQEKIAVIKNLGVTPGLHLKKFKDTAIVDEDSAIAFKFTHKHLLRSTERSGFDIATGYYDKFLPTVLTGTIT